MTEVKQHHSGEGNNIAGNLIVNNQASISPDALKEQINDILSSIRHRLYADAGKKILFLRSHQNLKHEAISIINVLQLQLSLSLGQKPEDAVNKLNTYRRENTDPYCSDIIVSTQIRLDSINGSLCDARSRYEALEPAGSYSCEAFYEHVANENELSRVFAKKRPDLTENELCGLVRGAFRVAAIELAISIAKHMENISSGLNSKILVSLAELQYFFERKINGIQYWSISRTLKEELVTLCNKTNVLLNETEGNDRRVFNLAASLLRYIYGDHKSLADTCWKYIAKFEESFPGEARILRSMYEENTFADEELYSLVKEAKRNEVYRKATLDKIVNSSEATLMEASLLRFIGDDRYIQRWLKLGGHITNENQFENDFLMLELESIVCNGDFENKELIKEKIRKVSANEKNRPDLINQIRVLELSKRLLQIQLSIEVVELLKPHIPIKDLWVSPLVLCYLQALYGSEQFDSLKQLLSEIDQSIWTPEVWEIQSLLYDRAGRPQKAIQAIEISLKNNILIPFYWYLLIYFHQKNGSNKEIITKILKRVPDDIFNRPSDYGYHILATMTVLGNFLRAERHLMNWFVSDPVNNARPLTDFHFGTTCLDVQTVLNPSSTVGVALGGVVYENEEGKPFTRLLVDIDQPVHDSFIYSDSPLGKLLSSMNIGEVRQHYMDEIKVLEKLPPYVAAFRIAAEIRHKMNDGSDSFYMMSLPKESDQLPTFLERKLGAISNNNRLRLDDCPNIPISMRGHECKKGSPVKAAIYQLTSDKTSKGLLPGFGVLNPSIIILDIYTVMYLVITGLVYGFETAQVKVILTSETKYFLEEWLNDVNREDYLEIGVRQGGGLFRLTKEELREITGDWQEAVLFLLSLAVIEHLPLIDTPPDLLKIQDCVDQSVSSSLKLAYANEIAWLSIDHILTQCILPIGLTIVNTFEFFENLGRFLPIEKKSRGLALHGVVDLPYPLTYKELYQLCQSQDDCHRLLLSTLIYKYPNAFSNTQEAVNFLSLIIQGTVINGFMENGKIVFPNPITRVRIQCVMNSCLYVSMQCQDGQTAERKLSLLISKLVKPFYKVDYIRKFILYNCGEFIRGHFLSLDVINEHLREMLDHAES